MRKHRNMSATVFLVTSVFLGLERGATAQIVEIVHPDNLARTHQLGCIKTEDVTNSHTPADLSRAIERCAVRGKYDQAIQLFFVYSVYGYFDQRRMKDRTAASAISVLNSEIFENLNKRQRDGIQMAVKKMQDPSGSLFKGTCAATERLGPPNYVPYYMLAHGMKAFRIVDDQVHFHSREELLELLENVDKRHLWAESLYEVNRCPR